MFCCCVACIVVSISIIFFSCDCISPACIEIINNVNYIKHASFAHIHLITFSTMHTKGRGERSRSERSRAGRGVRGRAGRGDRVGRGERSRAVRGVPMISY